MKLASSVKLINADEASFMTTFKSGGKNSANFQKFVSKYPFLT
jgi:hypothetical protein